MVQVRPVRRPQPSTEAVRVDPDDVDVPGSAVGRGTVPPGEDAVRALPRGGQAGPVLVGGGLGRVAADAYAVAEHACGHVRGPRLVHPPDPRREPLGREPVRLGLGAGPVGERAGRRVGVGRRAGRRDQRLQHPAQRRVLLATGDPGQRDAGLQALRGPGLGQVRRPEVEMRGGGGGGRGRDAGRRQQGGRGEPGQGDGPRGRHSRDTRHGPWPVGGLVVTRG